ncbi:mce-related protein [Salmonella enterica subsp. enterica]|uniref:Mce-related protein n=1 Tax=Salmonella enterica I TaxID=59201 RepID=A0A447N924_SALET|nr:mce-related protein [Salmonella enterica subsp. enterica]
MKCRQKPYFIRSMYRHLPAPGHVFPLSRHKFPRRASSIWIRFSSPILTLSQDAARARRDFELQEATITDSRYLDGLSIVVEAPEAGSLNIGTPVLFRGIEVGTVTGMSLGSLSDRVMITLRISKRYQYLVRNNSVFWLASGYSLDFGLTGGVGENGGHSISSSVAVSPSLLHQVRRWRQKRKPVSISCYKRANRKSGVNGAPRCHVKHQAPAYSRRSVLCYTARLFFCRRYTCGSTRCLFS